MTDRLEIAIKAVQIHAEMHPRPSHVNQQQAAEMLYLSHVTVRKMIRAGTIKIFPSRIEALRPWSETVERRRHVAAKPDTGR